MGKIALILRLLQFYAHQAHNLVKGPEFFADHAYLGEIYPAYEEDFDSVIERMIGLGKELDIKKINNLAAEQLSDDSEVIKNHFQEILDLEEYLCESIQEAISNESEGTKQLIGEIANKSESRQYKIKQRIKGNND